MFSFKYKQISNPEILKYINNKWLYTNNSVQQGLGLKVSDLVKEKNKKPNFPDPFPFFIFLSIISFMAGYNYSRIYSKSK
jgi:hypothetical protein